MLRRAARRGARPDRVPVLLRVRTRDGPGADRLRRGPYVDGSCSSREPLLLNRRVGLGGDRHPRRRDAGEVVPRRPDPRRRARDRRDQRPEHDAARGASARRTPALLSTIAANVGVAIQNARLFQEAHRRGDEMAALAEVGQEISATLDAQAVLERIGERVQTLLAADTTALYLAEPRRPARSGRSSPSASSPTRSGPTRSSRARGSSATSSGAGRRSSSTTPRPTRASVDIPGTEDHAPDIERLMVAPLVARDRVTGVAAVWRSGSEPFDPGRPRLPRRARPPGVDRARELRGCSARRRRRRPRRRRRTRRRARSSPR